MFHNYVTVMFILSKAILAGNILDILSFDRAFKNFLLL